MERSRHAKDRKDQHKSEGRADGRIAAIRRYDVEKEENAPP